MRLAFVHKNFRELNFEERAIFVLSFTTLISSYFPWFSYPGNDGHVFQNIFQGETFLLGILIFLSSLVIFLFFLGKIFELKIYKKLRKAINKDQFFLEKTLLVLAIQQLVLIILLWSIKISLIEFYPYAIFRFGISLAFVSQLANVLICSLLLKKNQQINIKKIFNH